MTTKPKPKGGKREGAGRKPGPPTKCLSIRVSLEHFQRFCASVPPEKRRGWAEARIDSVVTTK